MRERERERERQRERERVYTRDMFQGRGREERRRRSVFIKLITTKYSPWSGRASLRRLHSASSGALCLEALSLDRHCVAPYC